MIFQCSQWQKLWLTADKETNYADQKSFHATLKDNIDNNDNDNNMIISLFVETLAGI